MLANSISNELYKDIVYSCIAYFSDCLIVRSPTIWTAKSMPYKRVTHD